MQYYTKVIPVPAPKPPERVVVHVDKPEPIDLAPFIGGFLLAGILICKFFDFAALVFFSTGHWLPGLLTLGVFLFRYRPSAFAHPSTLRQVAILMVGLYLITHGNFWGWLAVAQFVYLAAGYPIEVKILTLLHRSRSRG